MNTIYLSISLGRLLFLSAYTSLREQWTNGSVEKLLEDMLLLTHSFSVHFNSC